MGDVIFTAILSTSFAVYGGSQFYVWVRYNGLEAASAFISGTISILAATAIWKLV